ncbi:MAG: CPBP family intramembrane metalloprotease [Proteobacteria bacterium]|nr:CPBP family intramembrane metalloprotease [Pseudomonadota bacterium]
MILGFAVLSLAYVLSAQPASRAMPWHGTPLQALVALVGAALGIGLYKLFCRYVEGVPDFEFPLASAGRELGAGLLFGFLLFSAMTGVVWLLGGIQFHGVRGMGNLWGMMALGILSGTFEEILFRGILFRRIETMLGTWASLAITSILFGVGHIFNPGATWFSSFAISVEAGILLCAAYLVTRHLWFPIAIHAAWNFTQGWVFSIPVSGGAAPEGLLITTRSGPQWLTGGDFGLEASAVAMVVATLAGVVLLTLAIRRDGVRPPIWVRRKADQTNE